MLNNILATRVWRWRLQRWRWRLGRMNGMTDLLVRIETRNEWCERALQAMRAAREGRLRPTQHSISFLTYADTTRFRLAASKSSRR